MSKKELAKRYLLFVVGLFFSGLGVAFSKHGAIGVTPISSIPNIVNLRVPALSMGTLLIFWNCILVTGQILILRKKFKIVNILQIPLSLLFGLFTDFGLFLFKVIPIDPYFWRIICVVLGTLFLGFGIAIQVVANVIMNSGEAFVKAVSDTINKEFGNVKVVFDICNVVAAIILSLIFFGKIEGTREGTIIAALTLGFVVKFMTPRIKPILMKFIEG